MKKIIYTAAFILLTTLPLFRKGPITCRIILARGIVWSLMGWMIMWIVETILVWRLVQISPSKLGSCSGVLTTQKKKILSKMNSNDHGGYQLGIWKTSDQLTIWSGNGTVVTSSISSFIINLNQWHHIAWVHREAFKKLFS